MSRQHLATLCLLLVVAGCKTSGTGASPQATPPDYKPGSHKYGFAWLDNDDKWDHVDGLPQDMREYDGAD